MGSMSRSAFVTEVSTAEFPEAVLARSREVPVLVDFWAPWCAPCRYLGPTLERLAEEYDGAFVLAKVNSDENPELGARYGVRGIPNVLLFQEGEVVDQFVGALPEEQVRAFLRPWCPSEADHLAEEATQLLDTGDEEGARRVLQEALTVDPAAAVAHLGLARLSLADGDLKVAREHLEAIKASDDEYDAAQGLLAAVALAREAAETDSAEACADRVEADAEDLEARYALGGHAVAAGRYREALEHYLAVARADPRWHDEAPRKAMVTVFGIVGAREPLSEEYRDHLRALYY
jgi:putative thioredoxin